MHFLLLRCPLFLPSPPGVIVVSILSARRHLRSCLSQYLAHLSPAQVFSLQPLIYILCIWVPRTKLSSRSHLRTSVYVKCVNRLPLNVAHIRSRGLTWEHAMLALLMVENIRFYSLNIAMVKSSSLYCNNMLVLPCSDVLHVHEAVTSLVFYCHQQQFSHLLLSCTRSVSLSLTKVLYRLISFFAATWSTAGLQLSAQSRIRLWMGLGPGLLPQRHSRRCEARGFLSPLPHRQAHDFTSCAATPMSPVLL